MSILSAKSVTPEVNLDVPKLRKYVEWVEEQETLDEAEREWYQGNWFLQSERFHCGTVMCVAGKIAFDAGWKPLFREGNSTDAVIKDGVVREAEDVALEELGLGDEITWLFDGGNSAAMVRQAAEDLVAEYTDERL